MKLRTLALISAFALAAVGVLAGTSLVVVTDYLQDAATGIGDSVESVYAAEELERNLLLHSRSALLAGLTGQVAYREQHDTAERRIEELLLVVRRHQSTAPEAVVLDRVEATVRDYLATPVRIDDTQSALDSYVASRAPLESARVVLDELIQLNRDQAALFGATIGRQDRVADRLGSFVALVCLVVGSVLAFLGWQLLYTPMVALNRTIAKFADGNAQARCDVAGLHELEQISVAFNDMANRLARQKQTQLRFLASIAHDLRSPLGAIRMSSELLHPESGVPESKRARIVDAIRRQAAYLENLIGDLLDTARVEAGDLTIEPHENDLRTLVQEVATLFQALSSDHPIEVSLPAAPVLCRFDPQRMEQVMNNLVSNAIKYSPHGGTIEISTYLERDSGVIAVRDHGMGISAADRRSIFEPFHRSAATRETIPGVGLGLSVSRKIVESHGGRIDVDSEPGAGTTFRIFLPAAEGTQLQ